MFLSKRTNGIYHLYYKKLNGRLTSVSTKTKLKSEANKFLIRFNSNIKIENDRSFIPITLQKFSFIFLKHSEIVHTYWTNYTYKQTFRFLNKYYQNKFISDLTAGDINKYLEARIQSASVYQARKDLINISAAFNWAIVEGHLLNNPCKHIKK